MIKAVILDMDGTMIDTEQVSSNQWPAVGEKFGFSVSDQFVNTFLGLTGKVKAEKLRELLPSHIDELEVLDYFRSLVRKSFENSGMIIKPGLYELLTYLKSTNLKLAVASAAPTPRVESILSQLNIHPLFDVVIGGDRVLYPKPDPAIYLLTASRLGLQCEECIVIEDSRVGIASAFAARTIPILVPDVEMPDSIMRSQCQYIVKSLHDVIEVLQTLLNTSDNIDI